MIHLIKFLTVLTLLFTNSLACAGTATTNGYFYMPSLGARGVTEYNLYNSALIATDIKLKAMYDSYLGLGSTYLPIATYINTASQDPGHKHSKLWASDGSSQALSVDASGFITTTDWFGINSPAWHTQYKFQVKVGGSGGSGGSLNIGDPYSTYANYGTWICALDGSSTNYSKLYIDTSEFHLLGTNIYFTGIVRVSSDVYLSTSGKGVILKNAAGTVTKRVRLNDAGDGLIFETP